ncbi:hypothetical protein GH140_00405 [bacterium]|nr:hypothetical protein [bacterium]
MHDSVLANSFGLRLHLSQKTTRVKLWNTGLILELSSFPEHPKNNYFSAAKKNPNAQFFKVIFLDFPGHDEKSWKKEYERIIADQNQSLSLEYTLVPWARKTNGGYVRVSRQNISLSLTVNY